MSVIIDYSTARPSVAQLRSAGVEAVIRYIGWDSVSGFPSIGKNITKSEADGLLASGIDVGLVFEYNANAPAMGAGQGHKDGVLALEQVYSELDAPEGICVYFAIDFDVPDYAPGLADTPANAMAKLGPVGEYFKAIRALNPKYSVGAYGGYWPIKRLLDAAMLHYSWQASAWSGGNVDTRINLYQSQRTSPIKDSDLDIDQNRSGWGSWLQAKAALAPKPPPSPVPGAPTLADAKAAMAAMAALSSSASAAMGTIIQSAQESAVHFKTIEDYLNSQKG